MNSYINYMLEANICLLIFGLFYYLVLRNDTNFKFSRYYLLGSALLTLIIPLLHFSNPFTGENTFPLVSNLQTITLPELVISNEVSTGSSAEASIWSLSLVITIVYISVMLIMLTVFLYQIYQIISFKRTKSDAIIRGSKHLVIPTDGQLPTFAFFNMIFFDNTAPLSELEKEKIMEHEAAHVRQRHSLDIIILEIVKIIFWINPVAWWMHKSIKNVHEYLADQSILKNTAEEDYSSLLAKMALRQMSLPLGHHFNKSMTLKRIKMIKSPKTKFKNWKWASMILVVALVVTVFSCNDVSEVMETAVQKEVPASMEPELTRLQKQYPDAEFVYMETDISNKDRLDNLDKIDPKSIAFVKEWKDRGMLGLLVSKNGPVKNMPDADGVYTIVEEPAMPEGGYETMYAKLAEALVYPEQARELGIEGKVFVQFIVEADGRLNDFTVVKGIGGGCDTAALEAMKTIEPFKPARQRGKAVKQRLVLPISFKLGTNTSSLKTDENKAKVVGEKMEVETKRDGLTVSGKVLDAFGKPLAGVNIVVKGTSHGTVSNVFGTFKVTVFKESDQLVFSHVSYTSKSLFLDNC